MDGCTRKSSRESLNITNSQVLMPDLEYLGMKPRNLFLQCPPNSSDVEPDLRPPIFSSASHLKCRNPFLSSD